jgi:hypothetical protein
VIPYSVTINSSTFAGDLAALVEALRPDDLPKLEKACLHLSGLHAVFTQLLAPEPADADLRAELEHQKKLVETLCDRVAVQAEMLARRAEAAAAPPRDLTAQVERIEHTVRSHDDMIERIADELGRKGDAAPGDAPLGPQEYRDDKAPPLPTAPEPAPAPVEPGVVAVQAEPASTRLPLLAGSQKERSGLGQRNRLAIARALVNGPLSLKEVAAATGIVYGTVASILASHNTMPAWFVRDDARGAPYQLTDAGRKALVEAGYVLVPGAEPKPIAESTPAEEPESATETDDDAPITVQELARRQALAIAKAIFEASTPELSRAQIEAATGLSESVVKQRLMAGSNALGLPACRYFAKRNDGWGLTHVGVALVKERA